MKQLYAFFIPLFFMVGCSDFLDVKPKDKYSEQQIYSTRGGFYSVVNGIYTSLASKDLYGRNLTFEMIDILGKRYTTSEQNNYYSQLNSFGYASTDVSTTLADLWSKAYNTILNCNVVINNIEKQDNVLTSREASILRGEMLAVRAFLHFDLLRLFGPFYAENYENESIPYNESTVIESLPILSADSVLNFKILRDLNEAESLLKDTDPVISDGPLAYEEEDESNYLRYRQLRLNYYAVIALKARAYLHGGDKVNALIEAKKLLNDSQLHNHFPAIDASRLLGNTINPDRVFSSEVLFGIYDRARKDIYTNYYDVNYAGSNILLPRLDFIQNLFEIKADYRYQSQWQLYEEESRYSIFIKYKGIELENTSENQEYFYATLISLIRLSEVYYIAAECEPEITSGNNWLNIIRTRRGLPEVTLANETQLINEIKYEYIKEFYGEGQAFFLFKRMQSSMPSTFNGYNTSTIAATDANYVPGLPVSELENR